MPELAYRRLVNQSIADPHFVKPEDVVRSLGAMQAQDYGQAVWALGLRTKSAELGDVLAAIEYGSILRTWSMRGTIHAVLAEDAGWMVALTARRTLDSAAARHAALGLSDKDFRKAESVVRGTLTGGKRLARLDLMKLLERDGIATTGQRGYHILWTLALMGVLCIGPMADKQQTYVLLDEWVSHPRKLTREEGLGVLAQRYFAGHGPATVADFAAWSGQLLRDAALGLEIAKGDLTSESFGGQLYWMGREEAPIESRSVSSTYLLAGFDEYLLGYKDRTAVVAPGRLVASSNGIFFPLIVSRGQVAGTWKRIINRNDIKISLSSPEPLSPEIKHEVGRRAEAYGRFMGLPVVLTESSAG